MSIPDSPSEANKQNKKPFRINKFMIGGALIVIAGILLAIVSMRGNTQYYLTVDELRSQPDKWQQNIRVSGAVIGDSIHYDQQKGMLSFSVANIPGDNRQIDAMGGIALVLHQAVSDPSRQKLQVVYYGPQPDLLTNEAQAVMTGKMQPDGTFLADELLLKCPSKYEEAPTQGNPQAVP